MKVSKNIIRFARQQLFFIDSEIIFMKEKETTFYEFFSNCFFSND